jgi:hypothetical protein
MDDIGGLPRPEHHDATWTIWSKADRSRDCDYLWIAE